MAIFFWLKLSPRLKFPRGNFRCGSVLFPTIVPTSWQCVEYIDLNFSNWPLLVFFRPNLKLNYHYQQTCGCTFWIQQQMRFIEYKNSRRRNQRSDMYKDAEDLIKVTWIVQCFLNFFGFGFSDLGFSSISCGSNYSPHFFHPTEQTHFLHRRFVFHISNQPDLLPTINVRNKSS